jgi:hypothetical protein
MTERSRPAAAKARPGRPHQPLVAAADGSRECFRKQFAGVYPVPRTGFTNELANLLCDTIRPPDGFELEPWRGRVLAPIALS